MLEWLSACWDQIVNFFNTISEFINSALYTFQHLLTFLGQAADVVLSLVDCLPIWVAPFVGITLAISIACIILRVALNS